jgi:hypothetical protein
MQQIMKFALAAVAGGSIAAAAMLAQQQQPAQRPAPAAARPSAPAPSAPAPSARQPIRPSATSDQGQKVVVYKTPTCGCCGKWVDYMRAAGYTVEVHDQDDLTALKRAAGISEANSSCHTAQIGGYVVEGHVPVESIRRLLRERPAIRGLTVPGMIVGTPGMESGNQHPPYDVVAIGRDGRNSVYERH